MTTVRNVLKSKGHQVWSIAPTAFVIDALKMMAEKNVGVLLVKDESRLVGVFSERDYARKIVLKGETSQTTLLKDVMTTSIISVRPEQSIDECMALMTSKHVRHLPVIENDKLVGLISIGDIVKAIISEHEYTIKQLENYITGAR
jgi:CBS domain-containing protein